MYTVGTIINAYNVNFDLAIMNYYTTHAKIQK